MNFERYYFYYVDFDGNLYHDNTILTDIKFLNFFFKQIDYNRTGYFENYPYISPCGKEMNFIACPDTPIVFKKIEKEKLFYSGDLFIEFNPKFLYYVETSSQLYYPLNNKNLYGRIGKYVLNELSNFIVAIDNQYYYKGIPIPQLKSFSDLIKLKVTNIKQ